MSISEVFRTAAFNMVEKFSPGYYVFKKIIGESYDTETGAVSVTYDSFSVKAVDDKAVVSITNSGLVKGNSAVITSGLHLNSKKIAIGDLIVFPDGEPHTVVDVYSDAYSAAYIFGVDKNV